MGRAGFACWLLAVLLAVPGSAQDIRGTFTGPRVMDVVQDAPSSTLFIVDTSNQVAGVDMLQANLGSYTPVSMPGPVLPDRIWASASFLGGNGLPRSYQGLVITTGPPSDPLFLFAVDTNNGEVVVFKQTVRPDGPIEFHRAFLATQTVLGLRKVLLLKGALLVVMWDSIVQFYDVTDVMASGDAAVVRGTVLCGVECVDMTHNPIHDVLYLLDTNSMKHVDCATVLPESVVLTKLAGAVTSQPKTPQHIWPLVDAAESKVLLWSDEGYAAYDRTTIWTMGQQVNDVIQGSKRRIAAQTRYAFLSPESDGTVYVLDLEKVGVPILPIDYRRAITGLPMSSPGPVFELLEDCLIVGTDSGFTVVGVSDYVYEPSQAPPTLAPPPQPTQVPPTPAPATQPPVTQAPPAAPTASPPAPPTAAPPTPTPPTPTPPTPTPPTATATPATPAPPPAPTPTPTPPEGTKVPPSAAPPTAPTAAVPTTRPPLGPYGLRVSAPEAGTAFGGESSAEVGLASRAAAVAALAIGSKSGSHATRAVLIAQPCRALAATRPLPRSLHPTQWHLAGSLGLGLLAGNLLIASAVLLLFILAVPLLSRALRLREARVRGIICFPSAPLCVAAFLFQGTALGAADIALQPPTIGVVGIGVASLLLCCLLPGWVFFTVRRDVPRMAVYREDTALMREGTLWAAARRTLLGHGEWVNTQSHVDWVQQHSSLVRPYRQSFAWYGVLDCTASLAVSAMNAVEVDSLASCGHVKMCTALVISCLCLLEGCYLPHARLRDSCLDILSLMLQAASMCLLCTGYYTATGEEVDPEAWPFRSARAVQTGVLVVVILKVVLDVLCEVSVLLGGRRARLQREELAYEQRGGGPHVSLVPLPAVVGGKRGGSGVVAPSCSGALEVVEAVSVVGAEVGVEELVVGGGEDEDEEEEDEDASLEGIAIRVHLPMSPMSTCPTLHSIATPLLLGVTGSDWALPPTPLDVNRRACSLSATTLSDVPCGPKAAVLRAMLL